MEIPVAHCCECAIKEDARELELCLIQTAGGLVDSTSVDPAVREAAGDYLIRKFALPALKLPSF